MRYFTAVTHFFSSYRSAISIFSLFHPHKKRLSDIIALHFFAYSNTGIKLDVLHLFALLSLLV